jgi:hypothetical protein
MFEGGATSVGAAALASAFRWAVGLPKAVRARENPGSGDPVQRGFQYSISD